MSKIICEICGTVYPDNATTCPICGYPRNSGESPEQELEETAAAAVPSEKVRGGKFSNSNVKKRQAAESGETPKARRTERTPEEKPAKDDGNKGLLITVAILLAAVIFVGAYIGIRFFRGADAYDKATEATQATEATLATEATEPSETEPAEVKCTGIEIPEIDLTEGVEFLGEGRSWRLKVNVEPEDTTDELKVVSSDESMAKISMNEGWVEILSVGPGRTVISVICGDQMVEFPVYCNFGDETEETEETTEATEETEETTEPTETVAPGTLNLDRSDITFSYKGETFTFSAGSSVPLNQVTWTSGDESVVTIEGGKAVAVGPGTTKITASYGGETESCIIRCVFEADPDETEATEPTESTEATEPTTSDDTTWKLSHTDVTIAVGESFQLTLYNSDYDIADVTLSTGSAGISISGYDITGVTSGSYNTVTVTYNGQTYTCIVRVK